MAAATLPLRKYRSIAEQAAELGIELPPGRSKQYYSYLINRLKEKPQKPANKRRNTLVIKLNTSMMRRLEVLASDGHVSKEAWVAEAAECRITDDWPHRLDLTRAPGTRAPDVRNDYAVHKNLPHDFREKIFEQYRAGRNPDDIAHSGGWATSTVRRLLQPIMHSKEVQEERARRLLGDNIDVDRIARKTGLSFRQIEALRQEVDYA